jgi:hypothetical protein
MRANKLLFVAIAFFLLSARAPDTADILRTLAGISGEQVTLTAEQARENAEVTALKAEVAALKRQVCDLEVAAPVSAMNSIGSCV